MNIYVVLFIIIIVDILLAHFYPKLRGLVGEFYIKRELKSLPKDYIVFNNIMIKDEWGTHQIDHIVVSKYGIFVIETKFYYGYIVGNEFNEQWILNNKHYIHNPIYQNYGHIKALANLLNLDEEYFKSIICFSKTAKLKIKTKKAIVTQMGDVKNVILKFNEEIIDHLAPIIVTITNDNIKDKKIRLSHNKEIKEKIKNKNDLIKNNICPRCGSMLINKKGKYGYFIGCSNYPKCHFYRKI